MAAALLVGVPPATWLCTSQGLRVTHAAAASAGNQAPELQHAPVASASVTAPRGDLPLPKDDAVVGTLALADAFTIQVAVFRDVNLATAVIQQLRAAGLPAFRRSDATGLRYLVLVGPYITDGEVQASQQMLAVQGFAQGKVTHEDAGVLLP